MSNIGHGSFFNQLLSNLLVDDTRYLVIFLDERGFSDHHFRALIALKTAFSKEDSSRHTSRFKCYHCSKMMVAETSLVKKNHQIPRIINQKIAQKLIEKTSMTDIAHQLSISTSTVIRKLNDFQFKHDFSRLPEIMSWDEYAFTKGKMSFIAQDFDNLNIITVLEGRTQAVIRDHFLKYDRAVRCRVKIITMDMFSPYYDLAKQLRFRISRLRLKQSPRLFHSHVLKSF